MILYWVLYKLQIANAKPVSHWQLFSTINTQKGYYADGIFYKKGVFTTVAFIAWLRISTKTSLPTAA